MGFETRDICVLDKNTVATFMDSNPKIFSDMLKNVFGHFHENIIGKGIRICIGNNNTNGYNIYTNTRGYFGVYGDIIIFAENIVDEELEIGIDTNMAIMVAEAILESRGKSLVDCFIHTSRRQENIRIKLNKYMQRTKRSNRYTEEILAKIVSKGEMIYSPDDSDNILYCEITCSTCGSCKPSEDEFIVCGCERAVYCSEGCRLNGWRNHSKNVHMGVMDK